MKTRIFFIMMTLAFANIKAQNYMISFGGAGASTTVDSVIVQNLVQGTALSLSGLNILNLVKELSIEENRNNHSHQLSISPNPVIERGCVEFESSAQGNVVITITDVAGKVMLGSEQRALAGWNVFSVTGLPPGIFTVVVLSETFRFSGKLISVRSAPGIVMVSQIITNHHHQLFKTTDDERSIIQMQYNDGEQLLFTGHSGTYATLVPLVPTQSMIFIFNFITCTDAQGNHYPVVRIGSQVWMAKNLNDGTRINGNQEQTDNGIMEKYCYDNLESNCDIYGGLYQWNEMMQYTTTPETQGLCPSGWYIPTDAAWQQLVDFLGGEAIAGGKMKEAGTNHWQSPNTGATNSSGFSSLPGGSRLSYGGYFDRIGIYGYWWSSSEFNVNYAWDRDLYYKYPQVIHGGTLKENGFSVRCLSAN